MAIASFAAEKLKMRVFRAAGILVLFWGLTGGTALAQHLPKAGARLPATQNQEVRAEPMNAAHEHPQWDVELQGLEVGSGRLGGPVIERQSKPGGK
jgi:hypothetical protein